MPSSAPPAGATALLLAALDEAAASRLDRGTPLRVAVAPPPGLPVPEAAAG